MNRYANRLFKFIISSYVATCLIASAAAQDEYIYEWEVKNTYIMESLEIAYSKCWSNPLPDAVYKKLKPIFFKSLVARQTDLTPLSARNKFQRYGQKYCNWASSKYQKIAKELD